MIFKTPHNFSCILYTFQNVSESRKVALYNLLPENTKKLTVGLASLINKPNQKYQFYLFA